MRGVTKINTLSLFIPQKMDVGGAKLAIENPNRYFSGTKCLIELKFKFVCCVEHYIRKGGLIVPVLNVT